MLIPLNCHKISIFWYHPLVARLGTTSLGPSAPASILRFESSLGKSREGIPTQSLVAQVLSLQMLGALGSLGALSMEPWNFVTFHMNWEWNNIPTDFHSIIFQKARSTHQPDLVCPQLPGQSHSGSLDLIRAASCPPRMPPHPPPLPRTSQLTSQDIRCQIKCHKECWIEVRIYVT